MSLNSWTFIFNYAEMKNVQTGKLNKACSQNKRVELEGWMGGEIKKVVSASVHVMHPVTKSVAITHIKMYPTYQP